MIKATPDDRELIVRILAESFDDNQSVNYLVPQNRSRQKRLLKLMEYSFDVCHAYGEVFLNENKTACALMLYPNHAINKKLKKYILDARLIVTSIGFSNLYKALIRESKIKSLHPLNEPFAHLWYIGVFKQEQGNGAGTFLLKEIMGYCKEKRNSVYLETSTERNLSWYKKNGFILFETLKFSYDLYCFKEKDR